MVASPSLHSWLDRAVADHVADPADPALVVAVHRPGEDDVVAVRGLASVEHDVAADEDTVFNLASVSKQLTAACAFSLERSGDLDLDVDVRDILPELRLAHAITLRQCLHHTAGLRDVVDLSYLSGASLAAFPDNAAIQALLGRQHELNFEPGTAFAYSNSGYIIAVAAMERGTGRGFAELARTLVFTPCGMSATEFFGHAGQILPRAAIGYSRGHAGWRRRDALEFVVGSGGASSHAGDLRRWHAFLIDGIALGSDLRAELLRPARLADGRELRYAGGINHQEIDGVPTVGHSGGIPGYRAYTLTAPAAGVGITVLANRDDLLVGDIAVAALRRTLRTSPPPAPLGRPMLDAGAARGRWRCGESEAVIEVDSAPPEEGPRRRVSSDRSVGARPSGSLLVRTALGTTTYRPDGGRWRSSGGDSLTLHRGSLVFDGRHGERRTYALIGWPWAPDAAFAARVSGVYISGELGSTLTVSDTDGALTARFGPGAPAAMTPVTTTVFTCGPVVIGFTGSAEILVTGPGAWRVRYHRVEGPGASRHDAQAPGGSDRATTEGDR